MLIYNCKIQFIADYLQAKFSQESKDQVSVSVKKSGAEEPIKMNDPKTFLHKDKKGIFIPADQIEGALMNSGKDFKVKARRTSYKEFVRAKIFIEPQRIYLNKQTHIEDLPSYVKRKDGSRVPLCHPVVCKKDEKVEFQLTCNDEIGIDKETLKALLENAGISYGIGARHPRWGRFKVLEFKKA